MTIKGVAGEDVADIGMDCACGREIGQAAEALKRGIELEQWLGPELTLIQLILDLITDRRVGDLEKATDVGGIVFDNAGMRLKNIHGIYLLHFNWCLAGRKPAAHNLLQIEDDEEH